MSKEFLFEDYKNAEKFKRRYSLDLLNNRYFLDYAKRRLKFRKSIKIEDNILEVGSSTGLFSQILLMENKRLKITNLDLSFYFLSFNSIKNRINGDASYLPIKDDSFDWVFCVDLLHHVDNIEKVVSEMARVSKKSVIMIEPNMMNPALFLWAIISKEERGVLRMRKRYLNQIFMKNGLRISKFEYIEYFPFFLPLLNKMTAHLFKRIEPLTNLPILNLFSGYHYYELEKNG